jgi:tripeptide aminopeptidase
MRDDDLAEPLLRRFLTYTAYGTQSNMERADQGLFPSSDCQMDFARTLVAELKSLGLTEVTLDEYFYVLARVPATPGYEDKPAFGLSAHMDTASDAPGFGVKPQVHRDYAGTVIALKDGFSIDPALDADLAACGEKAAEGTADTIITSDGTTLLGADDKAGIAGIITMVEYLLAHPEIGHGPIEILFSPDEETGHGMDHVPLDRLRAKAFYTVDGGQEGELETECFNAWKADITFTGVSAHLGAARGKLVNAVTMAAAFVTALPPQESPEATDGYYGYFCPLDIRGSVEEASAVVFLRDFDSENMERRLARLDDIARGIEARYPGGRIAIKRTCQYLNMKKKLDAAPHILDRLKKAAERAGVNHYQKPIRGGTDGSRLTELGIPTPNVFTGGHNYHSRTEWASLSQMTRMARTLVELAKVWGE